MMLKKCFLHVALALFLMVAAFNTTFSQSYIAEAESNGFTLQKIVSDTTILSGENFSYTIHFSMPPGATNIIIRDILPPGVIFLGFSINSPCGSPAVVLPSVGSNGAVEMQWTSTPIGCSGSFVVTVNFPIGTTCNGAQALNHVCMTANLGPIKIDFCTRDVKTIAFAHDPWHISKEVIGEAHQSGTCDHVTLDSIITYKICIGKDYWQNGHLNLVNTTVTDVLPAGATLVAGSPTCGTAMTQVGTNITWNAGDFFVSQYSLICCTYQVLYPRATFPMGTNITNQATMTGMLGSTADTCGTAFHTSNQTCVEIDSVDSIPGLALYKYNYTNAQPGCAGKYQIWFHNTGSTNLNSLTIRDTIPAPLTSLSVGPYSSGLNVTLSTNIAVATLTTPMVPNEWRYFEINYTIPATTLPGTVITNCAYAVLAINLKACNTMIVQAPVAKACIWKEVCSQQQQGYLPGSVIRYRLRVQNTGGLALTGATITDILNPNLVYVGNPSYYHTTTWGAPCQSTSNWTGVNFTHTGNNLTYTLPTIPASCQDFFYDYCGAYGAYGVPFYYIEFDVKVSDTSALGNIPNIFTISGGTLPAPVTSDTCKILVYGTSGFLLEKTVSHDATNWASTGTVTPGSSINYKLKFTVATGSVGLRHITFVDLLPKDNAPGPPADKFIFGPCSISRGSLFDVSYASAIMTSPAGGTAYNNPLSMAKVNNFQPTGAPGFPFTGCGTLGTWTTGLTAGNKNIGFYFGPTAIGAGNSAIAEFVVSVPAGLSTPDTIACNTFGANGAIKYLINSSLTTEEYGAQLESPKICINLLRDTIPNTTGCCDLLTIGPSGWSGGSLFSHKYTITNAKQPISDICSVRVKTTPVPSIGVPQGGDLFVDGIPRPYNPPYNLMNLASYPAHNQLSFVYGIDNHNTGTYIDSIFVYHCDGDSCVYSKSYNPNPTPHIPDITQSEVIKDTLIASSIRIKGSEKTKDPIKYVILSLLDKTAKLFAAGGEGGVSVEFGRGTNRSLFIMDSAFSYQKGTLSSFLMNIVWRGGSKKSLFEIQLYNANGEPIAYDTTIIASTVNVETIARGMAGDEFELLQSVPNPSDYKITLYYMIGTEADIKLVIYNSMGQEIRTINEGFKSQGVHTLDVITSDLTSGSYFVKLISPNRSTSLPIIIMR